MRDYVRRALSSPIALTPLRARRARKTRGCTHAVVVRARVHNYLNPVNIPTDKRAACEEGGEGGGDRERTEGREREERNVGQLWQIARPEAEVTSRSRSRNITNVKNALLLIIQSSG